MLVFKPELIPSDICRLNPYVSIILNEVEAYAIQYQINDGTILVTSMMSDRPAGAHSEGRAVDISTRGWDTLHCHRLKHYLNKKYGIEWGSKPKDKDIPTRVCVYDRLLDDGTKDHLDHFHLQVRRDIISTFD